MYTYPYACVSIFQDHPLVISNIFERLHLSLSHFTMFPIQMYVQNQRQICISTAVCIKYSQLAQAYIYASNSTLSVNPKFILVSVDWQRIIDLDHHYSGPLRYIPIRQYDVLNHGPLEYSIAGIAVDDLINEKIVPC